MSNDSLQQLFQYWEFLEKDCAKRLDAVLDSICSCNSVRRVKANTGENLALFELPLDKFQPYLPDNTTSAVIKYDITNHKMLDSVIFITKDEKEIPFPFDFVERHLENVYYTLDDACREICGCPLSELSEVS